jgi:hypothetical protein
MVLLGYHEKPLKIKGKDRAHLINKIIKRWILRLTRIYVSSKSFLK